MWHGNNYPCFIIYVSGSYVTFPISGTDMSDIFSTFVPKNEINYQLTSIVNQSCPVGAKNNLKIVNRPIVN